MTITAPTAASMKLKFPEFAAQNDATIEFAIEEAMLGVDASWMPQYITLALMYLAAHHMMVTISRAESATGQRLKSESMDGMSKMYDTDTVRPDPADYTTTTYGARYLEMLGDNKPGVMLI